MAKHKSQVKVTELEFVKKLGRTFENATSQNVQQNPGNPRRETTWRPNLRS